MSKRSSCLLGSVLITPLATVRHNLHMNTAGSAVQCPSGPQWPGSCFSPGDDDSPEKQPVASRSSAAPKGWAVTGAASGGRKWGRQKVPGAIQMPMQRRLRSPLAMLLDLLLLLQKGLLLDMSHSWVYLLGTLRSGHLDCSACVVFVPCG